MLSDVSILTEFLSMVKKLKKTADYVQTILVEAEPKLKALWRPLLDHSQSCSCWRQRCTSCRHTTGTHWCWLYSWHSPRSGNIARPLWLRTQSTMKQLIKPLVQEQLKQTPHYNHEVFLAVLSFSPGFGGQKGAGLRLLLATMGSQGTQRPLLQMQRTPGPASTQPSSARKARQLGGL